MRLARAAAIASVVAGLCLSSAASATSLRPAEYVVVAQGTAAGLVAETLDSRGHVVRVLGKASGSAPEWSSDRSFAAWLGPRGVTVRPVAGGSERVLLPRKWCRSLCATPTFDLSPDGKTVLIAAVDSHGRYALSEVSIATGRATVLASVPVTKGFYTVDGGWSPNGERILYLRADIVDNTARQALVVAHADGSHARVILRPGSGEAAGVEASWSPDGRTVAFIQDSGTRHKVRERVGVLDLASGRVRSLQATNLWGGPVWSPDSQRFAVSDEYGPTLTLSTRPAWLRHFKGESDYLAWAQSGLYILRRAPETSAIYRSSDGVQPPRHLFNAPPGQWFLSLAPR